MFSTTTLDKDSNHTLAPVGVCWRPDLYMEIAKFIGRMTPTLDDYCRGFLVGGQGQFIAVFSVRPIGSTKLETIWYEMDHGYSTVTTARYRWAAKAIVPLLPQYLFDAVDKK